MPDFIFVELFSFLILTIRWRPLHDQSHRCLAHAPIFPILARIDFFNVFSIETTTSRVFIGLIISGVLTVPSALKFQPA
jgi:hypothetical protein